MITKERIDSVGFTVIERWSAKFDFKMVTDKATYYFEANAIDDMGAIRSVNHNGASGFGNGNMRQEANFDPEILEKLDKGEYESVDLTYETEVEKDVS